MIYVASFNAAFSLSTSVHHIHLAKEWQDKQELAEGLLPVRYNTHPVACTVLIRIWHTTCVHAGGIPHAAADIGTLRFSCTGEDGDLWMLTDQGTPDIDCSGFIFPPIPRSRRRCSFIRSQSEPILSRQPKKSPCLVFALYRPIAGEIYTLQSLCWTRFLLEESVAKESPDKSLLLYMLLRTYEACQLGNRNSINSLRGPLDETFSVTW